MELRGRVLIYDVGAHLGEDSEFYLKSGCRVVAIEANPKLAVALRERFAAEIASGLVTVVEAAIARDEELPFYVNRETYWGTTMPDWAARNAALGAESTTIMVKGIRFNDLLRRYGIPHYLKVDIEGADMLCISALFNFAEKPKYLSIESDKRSWKKLLSEFEALSQLGYRRFKVVDQKKVAKQECSFHRFEEGATGMFGDDIPGPWLTKQEAIAYYKTIFLRYRLFGDHGILNWFRRIPLLKNWVTFSWYDTHATL